MDMEINFDDWGIEPNEIKNLYDEDNGFAVPLDLSSKIRYATPEIIIEEHTEEEEPVEEEDHRECIICLCDFTTDDPEKILHCGHKFHKTCIDEWEK
jgi:hypothetical protein